MGWEPDYRLSASIWIGWSSLVMTRIIKISFVQVKLRKCGRNVGDFSITPWSLRASWQHWEYKFHGGRRPSSFKSSGDHFIFSLIAQTRYTSIWREELLYPSSTMVAEVGGILSLFLGVSFMTIWDGAIFVKKYVFL